MGGGTKFEIVAIHSFLGFKILSQTSMGCEFCIARDPLRVVNFSFAIVLNKTMAVI